MKKFFKKVTTVALVMAMAFSLGIVKQSEAKSKDSVEKIKISNSSDFKDLQTGDTEKIKYKITYAKGLSAKEKSKVSAVKFESKDKSIAKVNSKGVVTAVAPGKTKITVTSKANKDAKASMTVEVSSDNEMIFKYSNLYYVVPDGTPFPYTIKKDDKDAFGHEFDIKTNFGGKMSGFNFAVLDPETEIITSVATVDASTGTITVNKYDVAFIEASYKKDEDVGDSMTLYILTQAQFDALKEAGEIDDEPENTFDDGDGDEDGPGGDEDTDESEDEFTPDD